MKAIYLTITIFFSSLSSIFLSGCGNNSGTSSKRQGHFVIKNFSIDDFKKIEASGFYKVNVVKGAKFKVEITATPDDHKLLSVANRNGVLEIKYQKATVQNYPIDVNIVMPELNGLSVDGAMEKTKISGFTGEDLSVVVNGNSDILVENCDYGELELELNGTGKLDALKSKSKNASAAINGAAIIVLKTTEFLDAEVNGSGTIKYSGSPRLNTSINGSGIIKRL